MALFAGALYMLCFAFVTEAWHVYLLNAAAHLQTGRSLKRNREAYNDGDPKPYKP